MAKGDIMPYRGNSSEGMNPTMDTLHVPLAAGSSFVQGEPVFINLAGSLAESPTTATGPVAGDFAGIAAHSGDTVGATDTIGVYRNPVGAFTPGASPNLPVTGDMIMFWKGMPGQKLITRRFSTDGSGTTIVAPVAANRGDMVGLMFKSGSWGFDGNAATTKLLIVTDILNASGEDISRLGVGDTTGVFTVAEVAQSRWNTVGAPSA